MTALVLGLISYVHFSIAAPTFDLVDYDQNFRSETLPASSDTQEKYITDQAHDQEIEQQPEQAQGKPEQQYNSKQAVLRKAEPAQEQEAEQAPEEIGPQVPERAQDKPSDQPEELSRQDDGAQPVEELKPDDAPTQGHLDSCAKMCTPRIDTKASVMEGFKRHRAQVALIGDYGSCSATTSAEQKYSWEVDWGDDEIHQKELDHIGPYQAEHVYAKKGKYNVDIRFCTHTKGCDAGCTTLHKIVKVTP